VLDLQSLMLACAHTTPSTTTDVFQSDAMTPTHNTTIAQLLLGADGVPESSPSRTSLKADVLSSAIRYMRILCVQHFA